MKRERPRVVERAARRWPFGILAAIFILSAVAIVILTNGASGQMRPASRGELPAIDAKTQAAVIDSITAALLETYVFADKAARMDSLLRASLASGAYRDLADPADFMARLQEDVAKIYFDKHMGMAALPAGTIIPNPAEVDPYASEEFRERMRRANYAFKKAEILPGNVGYVKFNQFVDTDLAGPTAAAAMAFVANADALIVDLRDNGGGNASMIQFLAGYLFKDSVHLIDWYSRRENKTTQSWSNDWVPGRTMYDTPVYVLVSGRTGSAAEEFTFDLKNHKRATIVGETTGGAGNTVEFRVYDVGPFLAGLKLPNAQALDPETNTGWEAVGVKPDIAVPAAKALAAAHVDAIKKLEEKATDDGEKATLAWARAGLESELSPYAPSAKELKQYVGAFGPRMFFMEGSKLMYQRESRPKMAAVPMAKDLFGFEGVEYFRVRFTRDASGAIDGIVAMYDEGPQERNPKGK
jgi:hypothetical protein